MESEKNSENNHFCRFSSFCLDVAERRLLKNGALVSLTPKAFDVLAVLVSRAGHLVEKDELLKLVWTDSFVEEINVARVVHTLRKVLGEDENGNKFIETVAKKGYRFVAETTETNGKEANLSRLVPVIESESLKSEHADVGVREISIKPENRESDLNKPEIYPLRKRQIALALSIGLILVFSVAAFWVSKKPWTTKAGFKNIPLQTDNGEAYQHYRQGKLLLDRKQKGDNKLALASFEKAIELDPNYAAAYVGKADAKIWLFWGSRSHDDISQARAAVIRSLELDETNSYAHTLLCRIKVTYDWDFDGGFKECGRALELDPNSPETHSEFALFLNVLGREDEALAEIETAIRLSPTSFNKRTRGVILYYSRRYDEAIEQLQQAAETDPNFALAARWIIRSYEMKNDFSRAF